MKIQMQTPEINIQLLATLVYKKRKRMKAGYRKTAKAIGSGISHMAIKRLEKEGSHPRKENLLAIMAWLKLTEREIEKTQETLF